MISFHPGLTLLVLQTVVSSTRDIHLLFDSIKRELEREANSNSFTMEALASIPFKGRSWMPHLGHVRVLPLPVCNLCHMFACVSRQSSHKPLLLLVRDPCKSTPSCPVLRSLSPLSLPPPFASACQSKPRYDTSYIQNHVVSTIVARMGSGSTMTYVGGWLLHQSPSIAKLLKQITAATQDWFDVS